MPEKRKKFWWCCHDLFTAIRHGKMKMKGGKYIFTTQYSSTRHPSVSKHCPFCCTDIPFNKHGILIDKNWKPYKAVNKKGEL
jgi:hypothetical protein